MVAGIFGGKHVGLPGSVWREEGWGGGTKAWEPNASIRHLFTYSLNRTRRLAGYTFLNFFRFFFKLQFKHPLTLPII